MDPYLRIHCNLKDTEETKINNRKKLSTQLILTCRVYDQKRNAMYQNSKFKLSRGSLLKEYYCADQSQMGTVMRKNSAKTLTAAVKWIISN